MTSFVFPYRDGELYGRWSGWSGFGQKWVVTDVSGEREDCLKIRRLSEGLYLDLSRYRPLLMTVGPSPLFLSRPHK